MEKVIAGKNLSDAFYIIKALGIIMMVITHTDSPFYNFPYLFIMPLFFIVSGFFFKPAYVDNKKQFIIKRIKRLYLTFLFWNILFLIFHNCLYTIGLNSTEYSVADYLRHGIKIALFTRMEPLLHPLWFLKSLFFGSLIVLAVLWLQKRCRLKNAVVSAVFFALLCAGFLIKKSYGAFTYDIHRELIVPSVIYLGIIFSRYKSKLLRPNITAAIICFCVILLCSRYFTFELIAAEIVDPIVFIVLASAGFYMVYCVSLYMLRCGKLANVFVYIGKHTMTILILHLISFKILSLILLHCFGVPHDAIRLDYPIGNGLYEYGWIGYSAVGVSLPLLCSLILEKSRVFITRIFQ